MEKGKTWGVGVDPLCPSDISPAWRGKPCRLAALLPCCLAALPRLTASPPCAFPARIVSLARAPFAKRRGRAAS